MNKSDIQNYAQVQHKKHSSIETILINDCKVRQPDGTWVDGVVYFGRDRYTGKPMVFCRDIESFCQDFELYE